MFFKFFFKVFAKFLTPHSHILTTLILNHALILILILIFNGNISNVNMGYSAVTSLYEVSFKHGYVLNFS